MATRKSTAKFCGNCEVTVPEWSHICPQCGRNSALPEEHAVDSYIQRLSTRSGDSVYGSREGADLRLYRLTGLTSVITALLIIFILLVGAAFIIGIAFTALELTGIFLAYGFHRWAWTQESFPELTRILAESRLYPGVFADMFNSILSSNPILNSSIGEFFAFFAFVAWHVLIALILYMCVKSLEANFILGWAGAIVFYVILFLLYFPNRVVTVVAFLGLY